MGEVRRKIAYFSMEIGIKTEIPTYSGGLGVLAGDTLKAAADLGLPVVAITLLSEQGYFTQHLDPESGEQTESPTGWNLHEQLGEPFPQRVIVQIEGRDVHIQAWKYEIVGVTGKTLPVIYLDTNLDGNDPQDRGLTQHLYGGDQKYRLSQEIVLGVGGVRMLHALGYTDINRHHMNEGHAALLALELLRENAAQATCALDNRDECVELINTQVRQLCVFTTHTPVAAGHDAFPYEMVEQVLGDFVPIELLKTLAGKEKMNMTLLALNLSHYVNSVAKQHQHVSTHLFPGYQFSNITNGVHSVTWTAPEFQDLFDKHIPNWRQDSFELRYALRIPEHEIWETHQKVKGRMITYLNEQYNTGLDPNIFTIGFARRATPYKRMDLIFSDIERLKEMGKKRQIQMVFAGKAHPADGGGKDLIKKIFWHIGELADSVKIVYVPDYNMDLGLLLTSGCDIWLNTPIRPKEASGTSGMKAAHNGVPQFSVLDGWWVEGHLDSITGWSIGPVPTEENENENNDELDAEELYDKLEHIILPMYYDQRMKWLHVMRNSISFNASFFNTHRMVQQYSLNAYLL